MNNDLEQFDIERLKEMLDEDINPLDGFSSVPNYWLHDFARMALTSKQTKPVAWGTLQQEFLDEDRSLFTDQDEANAYSESCYGLTPLYTNPQPAHANQGGWTSSDAGNAALVMLDRIDTTDPADDDRIEGIQRIIRQLVNSPVIPDGWKLVPEEATITPSAL